MHSVNRLVALAITVSTLLYSVSVTATPTETRGPSYQVLGKRQEDNDTNPDVHIDSTENLRNAIAAMKVYTDQATQTLSQIKTGAKPSGASFTVYKTITKGAQPSGYPPSEDPQGKAKNSNGKNKWNIDHIMELQLIGFAFTSASQRPTSGPNSIGEKAWKSVSSAINGADSAGCTAIAKKVTVADNLEAIPQQVNGFKQQVFTGRLRNTPKSPSGNTYYSDFGPAVQKILKDRQTDMFNLMGTIGDELQRIGEGEAAVKNYFTSFAQPKYTEAVDFLSTWSGLPYPSSTKAADAAGDAPPPPPTPTPTPETTKPEEGNQACYKGDPQGSEPQASFARDDAMKIIDRACAAQDSNTILDGDIKNHVSIGIGASQEDPNAPPFNTETCKYGFQAAMDNCDVDTTSEKWGGTTTIAGIRYQVFAQTVPEGTPDTVPP